MKVLVNLFNMDMEAFERLLKHLKGINGKVGGSMTICSPKSEDDAPLKLVYKVLKNKTLENGFGIEHVNMFYMESTDRPVETGFMEMLKDTLFEEVNLKTLKAKDRSAFAAIIKAADEAEAIFY